MNANEALVLTGDTAVHHPADHAEQEEQITHEVAVIPTSCGGKQTHQSTLITSVCRCGCRNSSQGEISFFRPHTPL